MEKTIQQKTNLGIFVVVATTLLILALYFIGNRQHLFESNMGLKAQFHNVNGLQVGNNVRFSGIDVGTVSNINMTTDTTILVEMRIRRATADFIRKNAIASIGSDGLVGNMIINISPQTGTSVPVVSGDTLQTSNKIAAEDMLTTLSVTNQNAAQLTEDLLEITTQILEGEGTIALLLKDAEFAQNLEMSMDQIEQTSILAAQSLKEIKVFSKTLQTDGSLANTIFSDTLAGIKVQKLLINIEQTSDNLASTTERLQNFIAAIEESQGTLNYVVNDTLLPKDIETTVREIKESSKKLNENMEALKHNFLFRGYFRKLERQARKEAKNNPTQDEN